jgi:gliding motility-associated-like protein
MKYFYLTLVALLISSASFATITKTISGSKSICLKATDTLTVDTFGGTWSSSSILIASIGSTSGVVTGLYPGTAIISYTVGSLRAITTVTINPTLPITGNTTICAGNSTILSDGIFGGSWYITDPKATVTPSITYATVTGLAAGKVNVFYVLPTGCVTSTVVTINPLPAPITGKPEVCILASTSLTDATLGGSWSSSNPSIATVGLFSGVVTGAIAGPAIISYTLPTACFITTSLTVDPLPAPITGVFHVFQGNTVTLSDATPGGVWSSTYNSIATIDPIAGIVTGVSSEVDLISYTITATGCVITQKILVNPFPDSAVAFPVAAWYPFCGDFTDHSSLGRNLNPGATVVPIGTYTTPTLVTDRFLQTNNALNFDGAKDLATHSPVLPTNGDFTISCWIKDWNTPPLGGPQSSIILYNGNPAANGFGFLVNDGTAGAGPGIQVGAYVGGITEFFQQDITSPTNPPPPALPFSASAVNGWYNLMLVYKSGVLSFYVNNIAAGSVNKVVAPATGSFMVGMNPGGGGGGSKQYQGDLDDIAVFNTALTDMQRTELFMFNPDPSVFSLGPNKTICSDTVSIRPDKQYIGSNYVWSTKDTLDTVAVVNPPVILGGTTYSLTISKPFGCSFTDDITIFKNPLPINLGVDTNICVGDTLTLKATYKSGTYVWNTGDTTSTLKVYATGGYYVTVDSNLCVGHDTIYVNARVTPKVDLGPDIFSCVGAPSTMKNIYELYDTGMVYLWSTGSNADSLVTNTSGNFWLEVNNNGCIRSDSITALIVFDTFSFYSRDTAICKGRFVTGSASFNSIIHYQWTPTTGVPLSTDPSPTITPDTSAWYILTGSFPGCPDIRDSFYIDVQPYPVVFMGGNRNVCQFDTLHITAQATPIDYPRYRYKWTPATFIDDPTQYSVIFTAGDSTKLFVTVSTSAGCSGSDSALISVHPGNFDSSFADIHICPGDSMQLIPNMYFAASQAGVIASYQWHPGIYFTDSSSSAPWLHPVTSTDFRTIATSQFGCLDTFRFSVIVEPGAVLYLGDSVTLHPGESYQMNARTNCSYFSWFPPVGLSDSIIENPIATPGVSTNYIVHASTLAGCKVVDSIAVIVDPSTLLAVPNAFTPGSSTNGILSILKRGKATLDHFRVYNRWGNLLYETTNIDAGWDGSFNGKPQPFGVYIYEIEATTNTGKKFKQQGNVTLLR